MSLYRFVKSSSSSMNDSRHSGGGAGGGAGGNNSGSSSSRRLFVQGTREGDDKDNIRDLVPNDVQDLQALHTRRHLSSDVFDSSEEAHKKFRSAGTKYITTRVLRKTTTVTRGEEKSVSESLLKTGETNMLEHHADEQRSSNRSYHHSSSRKRAKISDIVVGEESNVSARDALLKWARRSTAKYPGVRVSDFTSSWKDGLAFNAIIHRNRPDLIDWRNIRSRVARERLETAFHVAEREYGVTRLLDPEDVDTHEVDEKSIITYISSLYDVFPEPPPVHPLYDSESQQRIVEYRDIASSLHLWIRDKTSYMSDRNFPPTLIEMKKIAHESNRFRTEEVPPRHRDKQRLQHVYRELQKHFETTGEVDIEPELHIDVIERNWNRLMMAHQERDQIIHEEMKRLERMQRLAEKVHREIKRVDTRLEDLESKIKEEARRLERLHPLDAKHNVDLLEQELHVTDENIQSLFVDVQSLREGRYPQASDLHKRVEKLHQRWLQLRSLLHTRLIAPLSSISFPYVEEHTVTRQTKTVLESRLLDTNPYFKNLEECIEWCQKKIKQLQEAEYGSDLPGAQAELNSHLREHNSIEQFHSRCEQCINAKSNFHGEELIVYVQNLNTLQKLYTELVSLSNKRLSDLETLQDFLQSASNHLVWLNEKEEIELTRDWSDRDLNVASVQQYYHSLMSELDRREIQFSAVQDRGESLLLQNHPASKCIESYMSSMNSQWSWILQLTLCLETHLKHAAYYQQFYKDVKEAENWLNKRDELLNTVYSQSDFTLDEGERLLKGMQELREELNQYGEVVQSLAERAQDVVPLKQRRQPVTRPIPILAICNYKQNNISIEKGEQWVLHDNSGRIKWRVSNGASGSDCNIPGVVFLIPPPDKEALEAIDRLKRQFERSLALWQRKQLRMRQNMIFSTIKVVRSWDLAQFLAMGADQRNAIRKALNEDAAKLLEEGDPSDPQLRRLRREMEEVNRLFDEFERRAREEEESKNAVRIFNEQIAALQSSLDDAEHTLNTKLNSPIPRDVDSLEHLVIQHKDFEARLKNLTSDVDAVQETFKSISRKTPALQSKLDRVLNQWNNLWSLSHLYTERMKCVEIVLNGLNETNHILSDFEIKLASFGEMPSELEALKTVHKELLSLQNNVSMQQPVIDQLLEDGHNTRRLVEKSRHHFHSHIHHDLDRLDSDLNKVSVRWNNICSQLVDRLRSCEAAYGLLEKFANSYQAEVKIIEDSYQKLNNLSAPKSQAIEIEPTKNLFKKVMERVPAVEQVNIDGGKFIREAKIYDLRLLHYCDWLIDEIHPSLEASVPNKKKIRLEYISGSGEAAVSHDLDLLNNRFDALVTVLYDRVKQMLSLYPEDAELAELVKKMEPKPLKTFRTEFSIYERYERSPVVTPVASPEKLSNGVSSPHFKTSSSWDVVDRGSPSRVNNGLITEKHLGEATMGNKSSTSSNHAAPLEATPFSEIRSLRRIHRTDECIGTDGFDILAMKGIVHPETKEILTVEEAIRLRILDVRTGKIAVSPKSKSTYISIEEAVHKKLVIPELAEKLLGPCGIVQDGRGQMSLLEAIQRELIDAERGPMERLKVNTSTDSIVDEGGPSVFTFESVPPTLETRLSLVNLPLTLYDLLCLDLVDRHSGLIFDRDTGRRCSVEEAVQKRILNPSVREIVDTAADDKVTISEALQRQLISNGKFVHKLSNEVISFHEAKRRRLIIRPLSLKDCVELEVLNESRQFKSPIYCADLPLADAIKRAVVDFDAHKTVVNKADDRLVTLAQAMQDGVITADASYVDKSTNETVSIGQAVERGLLYSVSIKSVFSLALFQNAEDDFVSFNDALDKGLVKYENGNVLYVQPESKSSIPLLEAVDKGFVRVDILNMLNKKVGMFANDEELTVLKAALTGRLNPKTGLLIDPLSQIDVPLVEAVERKLITEEGVVSLKSLLAISLSTQTITRTVVTYATTVRFPAVDQQIIKTLPVSNVETHITPTIEVAKPGTSCQALWSDVMKDTDSSRDHSRLLGKLGIGLSPADGDNRLKFGHSPRDEVPPTVIKKIVLGESPSDENAFKTVEVIKFADEASSATQFCDITCDSEHQYTMIKKIKLGESPSDDRNRSVIFEERSKSPLENVHNRSPSEEPGRAVLVDETKPVRMPSDDVTGKMGKVKLLGKDAKGIGSRSPTDESKNSFPAGESSLSDNESLPTTAATTTVKLPGSGEPVKTGKSKKSPIKKTLMKMLKPLRMKDGAKDRSLLGEHVDMPPEGWSLREAVDKNYFDPASGLLIIPGTDRQVSFEECIQLQIIDPASALVVEPIRNRKISLKKALDKQLLNCTGMYRALPDGESITMQEALQRSLVIYRGETAPSSVSPSSESPVSKPSDSAVVLEPIRIQPDVIFDPETALLIFVESNSSDEICSAVKSGKIDPSQVKIKLESGVESDLGAAIQNGSIDLNSRQYVNKNGDRIDFTDAIKAGLIAFLGYPLVAAKSADRTSPEPKQELRTAPLASLSSDEDEYEPSLAELTRTRVTTEPKYLVSIGKAKSVTQTADVARPVLLQKVRKKRVKPKDAIPAGIIDKKTADLLESLGNIKNSDGKRLDLFEALDLTQANPNAKVIKDPRTRDMISIKEAVARGIVDQSSSSVELLVPIAKSLSLPDLLRQGLIENGRIIHPETGNNLSLQEAIVCDIADPLSKIKDPATGNILTLKEAMESGVVGGNLEIKADGGGINVAEAATKGDIFVEEPLDEVKLPPVAMTLSVAQEKGLYDVASNCVKRPLTGELIPLQKAIEEGLIMMVPGDKSIEGAEIVLRPAADSLRSALSPDTVIHDTESDISFTLGDAAKANLIDLKTGQLKDGPDEGGTRMKEALKKGLTALVGAPIVAGAVVANILQGDGADKSQPATVAAKSRPSTLPKVAPQKPALLDKHVSPDSLVAKGLYDKKKRKFLDPNTGRAVSFADFITNESLLQPDRVFVKDPSENTYIPLDSALAMNILDSDGCIVDPDTGKKIPFFECLKLGWISEFDAGEDSHLPGDDSSAKEIQISSPADLKSCLKSGNGDMVLVRSPSSPNGVLSLAQAIDAGIIDLNEGVVHDGAGKAHDLVSAFEAGLIFPRRIPMSLVAAVQNGYYSADENGIYDAAVKKYVPLEEAVKRHIIDPALCECKDLKRDQFIPLATALNSGLINEGCLMNTISEKPIKLDTAVDQKLIINRPFSINLVEAVALRYYEPKSRKIFNSCTGNFQTVQKAIESHFIDVAPIRVRDAKHNEYLPLYQAVSNNIIDLEQGMMLVPTEMTLDRAVKKQFLAIGEVPVLADNVERPQVDLDVGLEVIEEVPEWSNLVFKVGGRLLNFQHALDEGIVDTEKQTVQIDGQAVPLSEALKSGLLVEVERPMALKDVINRNLFDEKTALFYDPDVGKGVTLAEAVNYNLICPFSVTVKDTSKGPKKQPPKKLNLNDALKSSVINGKTGRVKKGKSEIPLLQAYDEGIITDTQQQIPLQKALLLGFYDENDGKVVDPNNGDRITLEEALKRRVLNGKVPCYWDDKLKVLLSLDDCVMKGIVDAQTGTFRAPLSSVTMNLMDAQKCGYIVKIDRMGLHEAAATGFFQRGFMMHPESTRYLTLKEAIAEHLIDPEASLVRSSKQNAFVEVPRAIELHVIDDVAGYYVDPSTDERLWFAEAQARSYIIPNLSKFSPQKTAAKLCTSVHVEPAALAPSKSKTSLVTPEHIRLEDAIKLEYLRPETAVLKTPSSAPHEYVSVRALLDAHELEPSTELKFVSTLGAELPRRKAVCCKGVVFVEKPTPFLEAIRSGLLSTEDCRFAVDKQTGLSLPLKEAISGGFVDADLVLVKDHANKRLLSVPESFQKGVFDGVKNTIVDTRTSRLLNLEEALRQQLIVTDGLSLPDALEFGLYNPHTGRFVDPFRAAVDRAAPAAATQPPRVKRKCDLTLQDAIDRRVVDPASIVVRGADGAILTFEQGVEKYTLDPVAGKVFDAVSGKSIDLLAASNRRLIMPTSSRQAMEEKYRLCDDTLTDLLAWIGEIEDRLANQDVVQEDVNQLRNQINILKLLKEEIDSQTRSVTNCLDQVRQVVATGSEYLSRDEINNLEKKGKQLRTRYDRANERTDKLLRRLTAARDELTKFKNDLTIFTTWMEKAQRILEEKERSLSNLNRIDGSLESVRDFVSDVIAHQADLRFITMAAQKFVDESKEYLTCLNEFRTSLPQRLPHIEPISAQDSVVRNTVANVSSHYRDLLARVNALSDKLSGLGSKQKEYRDALNAAKAWLREVEPRAHKLLVEPIAADPAALEDQLGRVKALNNELVSQSRLIDSAKQALESLLRSVGDTLSPTEIANLKTPVHDLENKYRQLCDALAEKCRDLDTALVQSQGVQDALDGLLHWLNDAENTLKNITRPASLHKERLEDQMRELRVLQADVDSHKPSVDSVTLTAKELINTASNPRLAKKIETKLRDVTSRYDKLLDKTIKRGDLLAQIYHSLIVFSDQASSLERWLGEALEIVPEASNSKIEDLVAQKDTLKTTLDQVIADGKALINHKDVTDTANLRDRVKALELLWKELNQVLDDKHRNSKLRQEQLSAYEKLRDQILKWLTSMENAVNRLEPVSVEMESIKKQIEELKPIIKEHRDYGVTIDKLNDLGNTFDALNRPETPTRRRNTASPTKRLLNSTYGGRRGSQDSLPSPSRGIGYLTASPGGSSGFGSRRSSQDGFLLDEQSEVQQQLAEINNRYNLLGVRLLDRQNELDSVREELRRHLEHLRALAQFLDKIQRLVPKESVPQTKEESDKAIKNIKSILEEIYEKQAVLESTKAGINDLLRRKPTAHGSQKLQSELQDISSRFKKLHDLCKNRIQILEDLKDFHDTHDNLLNWLNAKDRMMTVLGPISSDSRMVQSQVQQVQVLREEFRTQQPQLDHFVNIGENILSRIPDRKSPDAQRISTKVLSIQKKWSDLLSRLEERANSLGAAADTSREFDAGLMRLKDALQNISDQLDDIPHDKEPDEQLRKIQNLERQLEGQRPLLADLEAAGAALCDVISDPTSRAEIQGKLSAVNRQYNNLQKKLDNRKAEIEGLLRDGRQFESSCARSLGWLADTLGAIPERLLISADKDVLQQQVDQHEPIYRDVMNKEHEIIMLLNKGKDLLARSNQQNRTDTRNLQKELDKIQQLWDRLRRDTVDRQTRLQTCMEHCKKYYRALEAFIPWLSQAENKLDSLKPDTYKRIDVEKQLRELSLFRNDVWKHSGEFENLKTLGETFLAACDVDKELVKQELAAVKARWDKLNNELHERTQWLEDTARRLADFSENLRDLTHSVQRCEDRLASHDALGGASRDPKMLERIKNLREEALALKKPLQSTRQTAKDLIAEASELGVGNATHLLDDVDNVSERLNDLLAKLDDRCSQLQSASTALAQYNEKIKGLSINLSALEQELDAMKPIGRDVKTVRSQLDDINKLLKKIVHANEDVLNAVEAGERLVDAGFSADTAVTREQTEALTRQLNKLDERAHNRERDLENVLDKLLDFQQNHTNVVNDIVNASEELRRLKPVGSEVEAIKSQKEEFANFRRVMIEPLSQSVYDVNKQGQGLIQTAAGGVNTSGLEKDLEKLNDKWNTLKDKLNERDRKLDIGLLQSGKFQEALAGLAKWLTDTEEMVANQKPPSADYKVVKAQLQEQKFLKKMLLDRQNSMSSLAAMGNEVAAGADPNERKAIERQLRDLIQRFDNLTEGAAQRMDALEQAMLVAKQFQDKLIPILEWLDGTEKKIKDMELIPTDEEKIQQRIKEHDALHKDILRKKPALTELTEIASNLMTLVGEDEAAGVADKLQDTADRYTALVDASDNLGQLLQASRAGLRHLVLTYQDLQAWMESIDNRLNRYKIMPVHTEKLLRHLEDLADVTEEIANRQMDVDSTVDSGLELMKHISNDEAIQLKDKLDSLQRRYRDLVSRGADLLKTAQEMLPLVQQFHNSHNRLVDWMMEAESQLQVAEPREEDIARLELDIQEFRPVLENINLIGPQLCQFSPGEGAATIEGLVTRDNRRFDAICEQIQRKAERIHLSKQRSLEVIGDIDELLDWFREVENSLRDAEPPSAEPDIIRMQLKEHRALNDEISSQKSRVRDVLSTAKKVLRESAHSEEITTIREKMEDLKDIVDIVSRLGSDRLGILEQALPLAEHFHQSHSDLSHWLDDMERQVAMLALPALRPDLIAQQQDRNELFIQSINEHRPLVEKLNKTGEALIRLVNQEEGAKVQDILDSDNARYSALRLELRQRQQALEKALQETSKFSDKLEGMLRALQNTAEQVSGADPISAHPPRIRDQIDENAALVEDLDKREEAFLAVKKAANDVINKAPNASDPAVKDMKRKLEKLNNLWNDVQKATSDRGRSLEDALAIAEKFWDELQSVMATLRDLQDSLNSQEPPAVRPDIIHQQQVALQEIKAEIDQTKPEVEQCRATGQQLMKVCGEPDKPEVKKHIEDLDNAWDNITALFAKREENLINAMEKAMEFHETLQGILEFLDKAEDKFANLGPLGTDIDAVKRQIAQLKQFKSEVDPHMVKVEALNRQAQELTERTSAEQAAALKEPLASVNRRWDELLRGIVERQRQLENALLRLGQFQHALAELLTWIDNTNRTLDHELKPVAGDPQLLEVELAKLKVLVNDIQAHQSSVDTLNDAGRQIIESGKGTDEASSTQDKLSTLNKRWRDLLQKTADRQLELEEALRDAQRFAAEIQDLLSWLGEVDGIIAASKPVGGLPETASEQLERFMEVYNELEENRPKVETVLAQGQEYLKKSPNPNASNLQHNLKTLKQRWDSVTARANDKKIKLEIALKEATEFHDALQAFIDWLTNAEKVLTNLKPVSRVLATILTQIEDHKSFQKDVSAHREAMLHLDKKGTHLKYFSQKQDVILIKNLLISVQHRWERVVAKSAERTRALDHGYKEAREFHDAWSNLMNWLTETEKGLDELALEASGIGNAPEKIKQRLAKHREFQRALSGKQATYDSTMRMGKALKEKAPKTDEPQLRQMMSELKEKWNTVCSKSVDRQRKLEEALLYCGQFKDALQALLDWLKRAEKELSDEGPVHGDLDTVTALIDQHKAFEQEFSNRASQLDSVKKTANELLRKANPEDAEELRRQLNEIDDLWDRTSRLCERRANRLKDALRDAEELHKSVHMLLEWLSDAEMKLRFAATLPEDDQETKNQLFDHEKFMRELAEKEYEKDATIALAQRILEKAHPDAVSVIKHWITIIQSRWDEVSTWAKQRQEKLREHLRSLQDLDSLLEELLAWLQRLESQLIALEAEPLPDDIPTIERLIEEHKEFMETTAQRQQDIDTVCKAKQAPVVPDRKGAIKKSTTNLKASRDNLYDKHGSRTNLGVKAKPDDLPHYGPRFPPKGSKVSEPTFRNPRCKQLYDKWRNVWLLAWERQRRLQEKLDYLREVEKVRNFSWDDWRKRFLKFMNHKKSRLTDLFRKMDKNNDGLIPRDDFTDGIIKTKFDTSKLEMSAVADMFDHDGAGFIDWKEFIAALRPDWEEKHPPSEAEKIHDEVKRLVMLCTCRQKFRVFQVGEGKYRFGDSQKLRLVRILRSTVMVRVGGGWVALDEFLVKNDPCRVEMLPMPNPFIPEEHEPWCPYSLLQIMSKGRTNIELREQFILADGVSQSMSAFKPKHNIASEKQKSVSLSTSTGPITKIRERTARSVPLGKTVNRNIGTPDSLSDNESSPYTRTPIRKAATPTFKSGSLPGSRGNSRPASRQGSKPPSRHGSNLSLDSTDDGTPSRIPRRSTSSSKSSGLSTRKPAWNGSLSSTTRSPSGLASPVSEARSGSAIHRASSIPTLSGTSSSSRIPIYTGASSSDTSQQISVSSSSSGLKTPSGSSTPAPTGSKLTRKSSAASDSSRKSTKTPTPTDIRAPFRL